jgi:hypothetical protein
LISLMMYWRVFWTVRNKIYTKTAGRQKRKRHE